MSTVTGRVSKVKQPRGGYIKISEFKIIDNGNSVDVNEENIHASIVGMVVDYLTRVSLGTPAEKAFAISLHGAFLAENFFKRNGSVEIAKKLVKGISPVDGYNDSNSIINACKLVTFDVWYRNPVGATGAKGYDEISPDGATIENISQMVINSVSFFNRFGPVIKDSFTFEPPVKDDSAYNNMIKTGTGTYGGYTATVSSGDGDFLTKDTLWDMKLTKGRPTNKHSLQLLMYWIMGQHSGQDIYKNITKAGIFNPRINGAYILDINKVSPEIISQVEKDVICY